jgi:DNA-binding transcriptional LysR family regulator
MELYHLRTFVAVAEEGNLTRAAKRLHLSQPAVSGHIKSLEEALELRLFQRESSGMSLTAAGRDLLAEAQKVLAAAGEFTRRAQHYQRGVVAGRLRIGTVSDPATIRVGDLLAAAVQRHPQLELELHHEMTGAALDGLREGRLDASYYYGDAPEPPLTALPLRQFVYRVVAPAAWAARINGAGWDEIAASPWVLTPKISTHYRLVQRLFDERGLGMPTHQVAADDESLLANLVASGLGLALLREDRAEELCQQAQLCIWPAARLNTTLWFVCDGQRADEPALKALFTLLRELWPARPPGTAVAESPPTVELDLRRA